MNRPCLSPLHPQKQLRAIASALGERDVYDSVSYCNRCGGCNQVCPSYQLHHQETFSPRGRNQILRLALEGKIKLTVSNPLLTETLRTCTLCGRCTQHCAGQIPTAQHVLELRRALNMRVLPLLLYTFLNLRENHPFLFAVWVRAALWLRGMGTVKIMRLLQLTRLPGLSFLNHADDILPAWPRTLKRELRRAGITANQQDPQLIYIPSLEAQFLLPDIAAKTLALAQQNYRTALWKNTATGLFSFVYGDLRQSRRTLRRLIRRHANTGNGKLILLTDSIDVYTFLKRAPQLFSGYKNWEGHARHLAACVRFVTDVFPDGKKHPFPGRVQLEYGALFSRQGQAFEKAQKILYTFFDKNLVECLYADADVPAFGYTFVAPKEAAQIGLQAVEKLARTRTRKVVAMSGLAALELNFWCKKFYPAAEATHFVHVDR